MHHLYLLITAAFAVVVAVESIQQETDDITTYLLNCPI